MENITDSILLSIKTMLGGVVSDTTDTTFDTEIIADINTVLSTLNQIGIGKQSFYITDSTSTWADFFGGTFIPKYQQVKTYVYLSVRKLFDPPTSANVANALEEQIKELEWRLHNLANY